MKLQGIDGSRYKTLRFSIRASEASGPVNMKCELKSGADPETAKVGRSMVAGIGKEWKTVEIPLAAFSLPSLKPLFEWVLVFDGPTTGSVKTGTVIIDDVVLVP